MRISLGSMRSLIGQVAVHLAMIAASAIALLAWLAMIEPAGASEPVVLTITGSQVDANRADFDAFDDAFLAFNDKAFEKAHALTLSDLRALPQVRITAQAESWDRSVEAAGPRLSDVLSLAGVSDASTISVVALDGYAASLDSDQRAAQDWVLAIEVDGRPLSIGGRGPAWLMYDSGNAPVSEEAEAQWVWSVYLITVE